MRRFALPLHICVLLVLSSLTHAQTFTTLANFNGSNGYTPSGPPIQSDDGNLYGVTAEGGTSGGGVIFQAPTSGGISVYQYAPTGLTMSGRLLHLVGVYYGDALWGPYRQVNGWGGIFEAGQSYFVTNWNFCPQCYGGIGSQPYAGLIQTTDKNSYFTTSQGGTSNACSGGCGTVTSIDQINNLRTLYSFNGSDGANPRGELMQATDGNMYGTTINGGNANCEDGCGTIFRLSPSGDFKSLYEFCAQSNCADGANPYGALVQGSDGSLYGTTSAGGNVGVNCWLAGCGTIFKLSLDGKLTTLYRFCDDYFCPTGANPQSGLIQATDGNFYGTAASGGDATIGTLFRITPQGKLSVLHNFIGSDGAYPTSALLQANDGKFYGVATEGGSGYGGTLFKLDVDFNAVLSVSKSGNGTVASDDSKIHCGNVCSASYESGDVVSLTATPDQQWAFASWTGCDGVQDNVCTVTVNHAHNVAATFQPAYVLTVSPTGNGTVTSNDGFINCGQSCSHSYIEWTNVVLTATPDLGWVLAGWSGCDRSDGTVCTVSLYNARNVSATFKILYPLNVTNAGNGIVVGTGGIYCGTTCSAYYSDGSLVTLTATPNPGYTAGWTGCDNVQGNVCTLTVASARNVIAKFTQNLVTLNSLILKPSMVRGGSLASGTLTLSNPAPSGGFGVALSSDHPRVAYPPTQVVVPGGQKSVSFAIHTFVVSAETKAVFTASAGASHVTATLTVEPPSWRGQKTLAESGPDTEEEIDESNLEAEPTSTGVRTVSSDNAIRSPKTLRRQPPPADPADENKEYPVVFIGATNPIGRSNGELSNEPRATSREVQERELVPPPDRVHKAFPPMPPPDTLMASVGPMPQPAMSFLGMTYGEWCWFDSCGAGHPPDPTGAVGPRHYIQAINKTYAVFDKATGALVLPIPEVILWESQGGACANNTNGDPVVLYDQTADRWILAYLAYGDYDNGPFYECIAVSQTSDPATWYGWNYYSIQTDQNPVPAGTLNDYPKFGLWNDGCLYMGADGYLGNSYSGQIALSINLSDMYSGNPARYSLSYLSGSANFGLFPATMLGNGDHLPPPSEPEYFVQESGTEDAFNIRTMPPGSCNSSGNLSAVVAVPHQTYNSFDQNIVPQPPPATKDNDLDTISDTLMQWVQYRKVGAKESLWVNHTTYVTGANTSPQWAQIDVTGGKINTTLVQQQIYRPDTTLFRWLGSLAVDSSGDMAMCYSTSNGTVPNYPSMACAGRLATDPLGQLPQGETTYMAGHGSQVFDCGGDTCHRWGDYSSTTVDPIDDCTFWHTNMFYLDQDSGGNQGNYATQIVAFRYPNCVTPPVTLTVSNSGSGSITSDDGYINCGSSCSHQYSVYSKVVLTANPAPGWLFSGWSGCDQPQNNVCPITLYRSRSVTAIYTQGQYGLSVSDLGTGTGTVVSTDGYINCGSACNHTYLGGTTVTLTGTPSHGSRLDGWVGCDQVKNNVCTVLVSGDKYVAATFNLQSSYRLTVQKWGAGVGSITSSDGHINCGSACSYDYDPGTTVTLDAQVEYGSIFDSWVGCDRVQDTTCYVKMSAVRNVTAKINIATYVLAASGSGNGTVSSADGHINCGSICSYGYAAWSSVVLNAAPAQGWMLTGWTGCDRSDAATCTVSMNQARNVSAMFKAVFPLAVSNSGNGLVIGNGGIYCGSNCSASYPDSSPVTLTGLPNPGYTVGWSGCDQVQGNVCSVVMAGARNITAAFTPGPVTLTSLTMKPAYVKGGQMSAGTLTLSGPAPQGGVSVALSSDHPGVAHPPAFVVVPGGKTSVQFAVQTFPAKSNTTVTITATEGLSHVSGTLTVGTTSLPPSLQ